MKSGLAGRTSHVIYCRNCCHAGCHGAGRLLLTGVESCREPICNNLMTRRMLLPEHPRHHQLKGCSFLEFESLSLRHLTCSCCSRSLSLLEARCHSSRLQREGPESHSASEKEGPNIASGQAPRSSTTFSETVVQKMFTWTSQRRAPELRSLTALSVRQRRSPH